MNNKQARQAPYEKGALLKHCDGEYGLFLITGQALGGVRTKEEYQEAYSFKHGCHVRIYVRFFRPVRDVKRRSRGHE